MTPRRREVEMNGLDFVVVAAQHGPDCDCRSKNERQVVAYPAGATRLVRHPDGRAQIVIDIYEGQEHVAKEAPTYRAALIGLIADATWQPVGENDGEEQDD